MIYDLIVVGNGLAARTFLVELFSRNWSNCQNFSLAQVYSPGIAPACTMNSTATVSLNGIEKNISDLGDILHDSFHQFTDFFQRLNPDGIEEVRQLVLATNEEEEAKLSRRYKMLGRLSHQHIKDGFKGVELKSYVVSPEIYEKWTENFLNSTNLLRMNDFVVKVEIVAGLVHCHLLSGKTLKAKTMILATGAYGLIMSSFFPHPEILKDTAVVAGSYLEKEVDLFHHSFYFTIDGHNLIYRHEDKKLILGSSSTKGPFSVPNIVELENILKKAEVVVNFPLGNRKDFNVKTGLRHKGKKRRPIFEAIDPDKKLYMINAFYKNGYSLGHYAAEKIYKEIYS